MSKEFDENVVPFFQKSLPLLSSVFFLLISYFPSNFTFFGSVKSDFGLICIYFWMLHRPDLFNLFSAATLGIIDISISSGVPGACLLAYLVMFVLVYNMQKYFNAKSFVVIWCGFMVLSFAAMFVKWLVVSVYYSQFLPLTMLTFSYFIMVAMYPLISFVLAFLQNHFIKDESI